MSLLIVTNEEPLREVVMKLARRRLPSSTRILGLTYADCIRQLTPELISETGYFVLELLRQYPGGLRAEGVIFAQRMAKQGKRALVFSPLAVATKLNCPMYWDVSSPDTLAERIFQLTLMVRPDATELERLNKGFTPLLALPPQHVL